LYQEVNEVKIEDVASAISPNTNFSDKWSKITDTQDVEKSLKEDYLNTKILPAFREFIQDWIKQETKKLKDEWKKWELAKPVVTTSVLVAAAKSMREKFEIEKWDNNDELLIKAYKEMKEEFNV
jgi:hypothetical protein